MRSAIFISVRDKATRLPGKIYRPLSGRPAIERLIERMGTAKEPDVLVVCTSTHPDDRKLLETARHMRVDAFAGSEDDKLDRYLRAAERYGVDFVAIVDGDDLFCDPGYTDRIISSFREQGGDYIIVRELPVGATSFGVSTAALRRVCAEKAESDTEVWGAYFTRPGYVARTLEPDAHDRRPELRMTLDYPEDAEFFERAYAALLPRGIPPLSAVIDFYDRNPDLIALTSAVQQKYEQHLARSAPVRTRGEA